MRTSPRSFLAFFALALAAATACKRNKAPAPVLTARLALRPAAEARADRIAEVVMPNPDRTLANVGTIAKKLALPFGDTDLRNLLIARAKVPEAAVQRADLTKPAAMVVVIKDSKAPPKDAEDNSDVVLAFAVKDDSQATVEALAAAGGKIVETKQDAVHVQPEGGAKGYWLIAREGAVCLAETLERLTADCSLVLEARKTVDDDLRVTLVPEAMARAAGTTLKAALDKARQEIAAQQAQATLPGASPKFQQTSAQLAQSMTGWIFDAVADTTEAHVGLSIDPAKGLSMAVEALPRPGSGFARTVTDRHAYAVDPALLGGEPPAALWASGDMALTRAIFEAMRTPLLSLVAKDADRAQAGAAIDQLMGAMAGPMSGRFSFEGTGKFPVAYDIVYALKAGTDGKKLLADLEAMVKAPWLSRLFEAAFGQAVKVKVSAKREGEALLTRMSFDTKKAPAKVRAELKGVPFLDGTPIEGRTAVVGDKMIVTTGGGGKARLAALLAPPMATPTGDLQSALAETKGADGVFYMDLAALLRPIFALAASGGLAQPATAGGPNPLAMAGMAGALLANARLATWGSFRGGSTATLSARIPMSTFESIATIVRGAMGGH